LANSQPHTYSESKGAVIRKKDVLNRKQSALVVKHQLFGKLGPKLAGEDDYQILLG
jgi:hypothetical protein